MNKIRQRWEKARQEAALRRLRQDPHLARDIGLSPLPKDTELRWYE